MFPASVFVFKMPMLCCPLGESGQCSLLKWTKRRGKSEGCVKRKHYLCNVEKKDDALKKDDAKGQDDKIMTH